MTVEKRLSREAIRKAAILVVALDAAMADALLEKMDETQARLVRDAVMELDDVSAEEEQAVLADFLQAGGRSPIQAPDGVELDPSLVRRIATSPPERSRTPPPAAVTPFHFLREATTPSLVKHLGNQHPQLIAVVLAHLPPAQAADVVKCLAPSLQASVLRRIAELDMADPAVLESLEQQLEAIFSDEIRASRNRLQGVAAVSSILSAAGADRATLLTNLESHDQDLSALVEPHAAEPPFHPAKGAVSHWTVVRDQEAAPTASSQASQPAAREAAARAQEEPQAGASPARRSRSTVKPVQTPPPPAEDEVPPFEFEDLQTWDDRQLARLFAECPSEVVLLALAGASPAFVHRLAKQLPSKEARSLKQRIENVGPVRLSDIEQAQRQITLRAWKLVKPDTPASRDGFAAAA